MQRRAAPIQGRGVIRLLGVTQIQLDKGLFETLRLEQKKRVIVRCVPVTRVKLERVLKAQDGVVTPLQPHENVRQSCPEIGIVGPDLYRFIECL